MFARKSLTPNILPRPRSIFALGLLFFVALSFPALQTIKHFVEAPLFASLKAKPIAAEAQKSLKPINLLEMSRAEFEMLSTRVISFNASQDPIRDPSIEVKKRVFQEAIAKATQKLKLLERQLSSLSAEQENSMKERIQSIIKMFEAMKPKDAAPILEQLDAKSLLFIVQRMKGKKLSEILSTLKPEDAAKITETMISLNNEIS